MRRKSVTSEMIKSYIVESLLLLLEHNRFSEITVSEITDKAGINRSTYYNHFKRKEDIVFYYFDSILNEYLAQSKREPLSMKPYLENMFAHFLKYRKELLLLYRNNLSVILLDVLNKHFFASIPKDADIPQQYNITYHIGGVFNHFLLWFSRDMADSPSLLAKSAVLALPKEFVPYLLTEINPNPHSCGQSCQRQKMCRNCSAAQMSVPQ